MPKYRVTWETGASCSISVEADDEEAAIEAASDQLPSLCAQCSGWGRDVGVELGDRDLLDEKWGEAVELDA